MTFKTKLGLITLLGLAGLVGYAIFNKDPQIIKIDFSLIGDALKHSENVNNLSTPLQKIVQDNLKDQKGTYAVYIEKLSESSNSAKKKDLEKYYFNEQEIFPAASLYKLVLIATVFQEIQNNNIQLTDTLSNTKSHLSSIFGSVDFGYEKASEKIYYTVEEALDRVSRISDNFAAIMLTEKIIEIQKAQGNTSEDSPLLKTAQDMGMNNTSFINSEPATTASDMAIFLKKLYEKEIVSFKASDQITELLIKSQLNNRIPKYLPKEVKVAHKTGELARIRHDAGIVYLADGRSYLIVLLSKGLQYEDDGIETLAKISKDIYEYFSK